MWRWLSGCWQKGLIMSDLRRIVEEATIFDEYIVTSDGRVFSDSNWRGYGRRELSQLPNINGYMRVRMGRGEARKSYLVHRLVANAFLPPRPSHLHQIRHLDGNQTNNIASNLAWGTAADNAADRDLHGTTARGSRNGFSKLSEDEVKEIRALEGKYTQYELASQFGVTQRTVSLILRRERWTHV
jgi:hypothetical protein